MTTETHSSPDMVRGHRPPNRVARTLNRLTSPDNGPDFTLKFHRWLYQATDGRLGHGLIGAPTLLLRTTGRRSGQRRVTPVVYVQHGGQVVIGATNGGQGRPGWFHNLLADPHVEIQVGRQHLGVTASLIDAADPRYAGLWRDLDRVTHGRFTAYASGPGGSIPLFLLQPERRRSVM